MQRLISLHCLQLIQQFLDTTLGGKIILVQTLKQLLIVLGFNDMSTLVGHFVSSPREREKRDRRDSRGDEREGQGRKRSRNESEETEEIKNLPLPLPATRIAGFAKL